MARLRQILLALLALWMPLPAASPFEVAGYCKLLPFLRIQPHFRSGDNAQQESDLGALNARLRIQVVFKPASWLSLDAAYDLSPRIQDARLFQPDSFSPGFAPAGYRLDDFPAQLYPGSETTPDRFAVFHNLDRFFLTAKLSRVDVFLGRQAIAWGSARIINPTDIIAPFAFNELDGEERRGVDALRVRVPLGTMDELDIGFIAGEDFARGKNALFLRGKASLGKTDASLLAMAFREHLMIGVDLSRAVGGTGIWLEAAYVHPRFFDPEQPDAEDYFRASLGLEYSFRNGYCAFVEYHHSSAGDDQAENYLKLPESPAFKDGSVYLMGKHYLGAGVTRQVTGLISATALLLINLDDRSLSLSPRAEFSMADNIYVSAGACVGLGKNPEKAPAMPGRDPLRLHSEFGAYPDTVYASFKIYF